MGRIFDDAVVNRGTELGRFLLAGCTLTVAELLESRAELLGHGVVYNGVDGTIGVDAQSAEEQEPDIVVGRVHQ